MTNDYTPWDREETPPGTSDATNPRRSPSETGGGQDADRVDPTTGWVGASGASIAVVETVAAATGTDPFELPPLHNYVGTDALEALLASASRTPEHDFLLSFRYAGTTVRVDGSGRVSVFVD